MPNTTGHMKRFNQLAKKNNTIFISSIKTKVAIKFPKRLFFIFFYFILFFFFSKNWVGAERVDQDQDAVRLT